MKVSSRIPSFRSFTTANNDFVTFYQHVDTVDQSAISSAFSLGKNLMKKSTGWIFGGGKETAEEEEIHVDPGVKTHMRSRIMTNGQRKETVIIMKTITIMINKN